ncbi:MAG: DotA/TraY family protein, partial [Desulfobacteraceae bacterium]|nr:DotA/TraY family protein [Desulfobacteraceae bacterium]
MSNSNQFAGGLVDNAVIQTTDWSKQILDHFFGSGWNLLTPSPLPDGSSLSLIFDILGPINVVALAIGSIILTWAFVKSVLDTANQGEAFGKQGLWGPIRSALAVALMAPLGKGLCALQILILLLIAGSINFANVIWSTGLDFMAKHDGQMVVEVPASIESNTERLAYGVLQSMAFQGFYNHVMGKGCVIGGKTISKWRWAKTKDTGEGYWLLTFHLPSGSGLSEGDMGRIIIRSTTETSKLGIARKAQVEALITRLKPYAKKIASIVSDEIAAPSIEGILVYEKTINLFNEAMLPHLKEIVASTKPEFDKSLEVFVNSAKLNGWLSAGS